MEIWEKPFNTDIMCRSDIDSIICDKYGGHRRVRTFGDVVQLLNIDIPNTMGIVEPGMSGGSEGQEIKMIALLGHNRRSLSIVHETSPFYVGKDSRRKAKLRIIDGRLK